LERDEVTLRQLLVMFRHCMAQGRFKDGSGNRQPPGMSVRYQSTADDIMDSLILEVKLVNRHGDKTTFVASLPVDDLRTFSRQSARSFIRDFPVIGGSL